MAKLMVGNAPCSWGTLEFDEAKGEQIRFDRMLDELAEAGYTGTELGDWGYMPTDPAALRAELDNRGLVMLGAFVPVALKDASAHAGGIANAVKTARLLAAVARTPAPYLVLADDNGSVPERTRLAGRVTPEAGLSPAEWKIFAAGADELAHAVYEETGLRTVFHHHCAGYVETPDEIATLLELTNPQRLGLVFDTGHYCYGAGGGGLRRGGGSRSLRRPRLVHPLQGLRAGGRAAGQGGAVGLLHGPAPRSLLRTGQGLCGFPRPAAAAGGARLRRVTCWWSRTFCPEWARRKRARGATANTCAPLKPISIESFPKRTH